jgi:hypothetical protein
VNPAGPDIQPEVEEFVHMCGEDAVAARRGEGLNGGPGDCRAGRRLGALPQLVEED